MNDFNYFFYAQLENGQILFQEWQKIPNPDDL